MRALENLRAARPVRVRTRRDLLGAGGRVILWLAVGLLLVRGVGATLGRARDDRSPHAARAAAGPAWPDDAARALAVEFATAYLTHTPGEDADAAARRLTVLAASDVAGELAPQFDHDAPAQAVHSATVAGTVRLDGRHALITVAATLATGGQLGRRWLTVPVARDRAGGVVVDELPSFAAAPARAVTPPADEEPLTSADRGAIEDVLTRFLRSYLAGDTGALAYLEAPGARIGAAAGRLELLSLTSVLSAGAPTRGRRSVLVTVGAGAPTRGRRSVLVTVHARDVGSRALYMLRYRILLVRRDRWYVAELNGPGEG